MTQQWVYSALFFLLFFKSTKQWENANVAILGPTSCLLCCFLGTWGRLARTGIMFRRVWAKEEMCNVRCWHLPGLDVQRTVSKTVLIPGPCYILCHSSLPRSPWNWKAYALCEQRRKLSSHFKMELLSSLEFRFYLGIHQSLDRLKSLVVKYSCPPLFSGFSVSSNHFLVIFPPYSEYPYRNNCV
jgi:hypothetical protein